MTMLRDYFYTGDSQLVHDAVSKFVEAPEVFDIVGNFSLSPDSFLWILSCSTGVYYLYAEDFVDDYTGIEHIVSEYTPPTAKLNFVPAKEPLQFESSAPVAAATIYAPPQGLSEFETYASQSGYDFVFLLRSDEKV